jgi:NAD(P)-dependent dehydrogenase (short-subunit alcohol dehydrogenase family)
MATSKWGGRLALAAAGAYVAARLTRALRADDLRGEVVLIMGGSRSLGLLLAREFAARGCRLAIGARDEGELAAATRELEAQGADVLAVRCDVGERSDIDRLVAAARERFGAIDILVNVAGLIHAGPAESMTIDNFRDALAVNFWGPLHCMDAVIADMQTRRHGRIVNITSIGGVISVPHLLPYGCAKAAAIALSEGLGAELRKDGITVTTVIPGLMRTGSYPHAYFKGDAAHELAWFRGLSTSPLTAMSARRAARRIVAAVARGESELVLTLSAKAGRLARTVMPGFVRGLFSLASRLLSRGALDRSKTERAGRELQSERADISDRAGTAGIATPA